MALSYANVDAQQMVLTPMKVFFDGVDLGGTLSNIVVTTKYEKSEIKADQLGSTVLDRRVKGLIVQVTTEITQIEDKDLWKIVFPHATEITTGTKAVKFNSAVGDSDLANAKELVLHPLSKADGDTVSNLTFFKACASAESEVSFGPDKQSTLKIVWNILPDTTVTPAKFYQFGDPLI